MLKIRFGLANSVEFDEMPRHFILVVTVCQRTHLGVTSIQMVYYHCTMYKESFIVEELGIQASR